MVISPISDVCRVAPETELGSFELDGMRPKAVAYPKTGDEVASVVTQAAAHGWALIPRGGGTQWSLGDVPRAADVVVCLTDMDHILEYEPADLVVTVEAGIRLGDLQRHLAQHGQFLALDPPMSDQATIGGVIAANASGPLRLRYGTCRDLLLGIKVVGADGAITKAGGRVVKNVTGYDMGKLYTGSLGTLGIIVEASFKLAPLPRVESTILASFNDLDMAYAAARAIHKAALPIRACDLIGGPATTVVKNACAGQYTLAIRIGGGENAVARQNTDVQALCSDAVDMRLVPAADIAPLWRRIVDYGHEGAHQTVAKLSMVPSQTNELLRQLPSGSAFVSHVLSGVTYMFDDRAPDLRPAVEALGGYMVLERCPLAVKQAGSIWGTPGPDRKLMERIKQQFDPASLFNPGRYVGGL